MIKKYLFPVILLLGLGIVLMLLPPKKTYEENPPEELLRQVSGNSRFLSADLVADRMINSDPSLLLIDVRESALFNEFSLPGALNIPLENILQQENNDILSQEGMDIVFYSTGDLLADQAWMICKRKGMNDIFVLKGGLNEWFNSFFLLQPPLETASSEEIALYQFRNGVKQYFTGSGVLTQANPATEKVTVAPRQKKTAAEGGC